MSMHTIDQAKNMRNGINLEGEVVRKGETRTVSKKTGGTIDVCDAYLKDSANRECIQGFKTPDGSRTSTRFRACNESVQKC